MEVEIPAMVRLRGYGETAAQLTAVAYTPRQRWLTAAAWIGLACIVTPVAAVVPPHVPWALIALGVCGYRAAIAFRGAYRVRDFSARCPACGADVELAEGTRVSLPREVTCYACHRQPVLELAS